MQHAFVTTGHVEKPNLIMLDECLPDELSVIKVIIEPFTLQPHQRKAGALRGLIDVRPDFDEPLDDFQEYMA